MIKRDEIDTVDGRNPAPVDMVNSPLFTGYHTCRVVQDFFHQQYFPIFEIPIFMRWKSSNIFMNHEMERLRQRKRSLPDLQGQRPVGQRPVHLHVQDLSCSFDHLIDFFMV